MTDQLKQAAQQALEALQYASTGNRRPEIIGPAIAALRTALEQQAEPPPEWLLIKNILDEYGLDAISFVAEWKASQRQWVGLEAEDLAQIESDEFWQTGNHMAIAMAVEAKLKERNNV